MKTREINQLIAMLNEHGLTELSYSDESLNITLKKEVTMINSAMPVMNTNTVDNSQANTPVANGIKAPLVGVYYDKPSPDASVFVSAGQSFKKGDVLCIIEAMKVMNEIKAPYDGVVAKVCFEDGQAVAFDDVLFELK